MMIARQNVRVTGIQASMHLGLIECSNVTNMPRLGKLSKNTFEASIYTGSEHSGW